MLLDHHHEEEEEGSAVELDTQKDVEMGSVKGPWCRVRGQDVRAVDSRQGPA